MKTVHNRCLRIGIRAIRSQPFQSNLKNIAILNSCRE